MSRTLLRVSRRLAIKQLPPALAVDVTQAGNGVEALAALGVDLIWLTPFYRSAQVDFGYDVIDHLAVDPGAGTLEEGLGVQVTAPEEVHRSLDDERDDHGEEQGLPGVQKVERCHRVPLSSCGVQGPCTSPGLRTPHPGKPRRCWTG